MSAVASLSARARNLFGSRGPGVQDVPANIRGDVPKLLACVLRLRASIDCAPIPEHVTPDVPALHARVRRLIAETIAQKGGNA